MENLGFAELYAATGLDSIQFVLHGQLVDDGKELSRVFGSHGSLRMVGPIRLAHLVFIQSVFVRDGISLLLLRLLKSSLRWWPYRRPHENGLDRVFDSMSIVTFVLLLPERVDVGFEDRNGRQLVPWLNQCVRKHHYLVLLHQSPHFVVLALNRLERGFVLAHIAQLHAAALVAHILGR